MRMLKIFKANLGEDIYYGHAQPSSLDRAEEVEVVWLDLQQQLLQDLSQQSRKFLSVKITSRSPSTRM